MRSSKPFKSSLRSLPSPDGTLIATLLATSILLRAVESLDLVRTIRLPLDFSAGPVSFSWASSSRRILVATPERVHVFHVTVKDYHATIELPSSSATKSAVVEFGATDNEVCIWSPLGIKLTVVNLESSKAVEISSPKLYNAVSVSRGCSFRPRTHHLALLSRTAGRDMISIHTPDTRELHRSWQPDTVDAQGLMWTPDGKWLVVWESSSQSHKVLFYTTDGHIFREWRGPLRGECEGMHLSYGAGVRLLTFSPNGRWAAVADGSDCIYLLNGQSITEEMKLHHAQTITPTEALQIWQEQANRSIAGSGPTSFVKATQAVMPPGVGSINIQETKCGCNLAKFDSSSALLATRLEEAPSTIWIWDMPTSELRAVLMHHANISKVEWHPVQPKLLLIKCNHDDDGDRIFVWDPISDGPRLVDHRATRARSHATWLTTIPNEVAAIFLTDDKTGTLTSLTELDELLPWQKQPPIHQSEGAEIPSKLAFSRGRLEDDSSTDPEESLSELDDTFHFKKNF